MTTTVVKKSMLSFAASDALTAWVPLSADQVIIIDSSGRTTTITATTPVGPSSEGPILTYRTNAGPRLFDLRSRTLVHLGSILNQPVLGSHHVLWGTPERAGDLDALFRTTYHLAAQDQLHP
jgi:hypothetical protein